MIVHFHFPADTQRLAGEEELKAALVENDRVGLPQVAEFTEEHLLRCPDERLIVQADHAEVFEIALRQLGRRHALEEPHRPLDSGHATHSVEVVFGQRFDVLDELHAGVHDPDVRP